MNRTFIYLLFLFLFLNIASLYAELAEYIVAVVDDEVIWATDVEEELQIREIVERKQITSEFERNKLRKEILNTLIDRKVLVIIAQKKGIKVTDAEVDEYMNMNLKRIMSAYGFASEKELAFVLQQQGLSYDEWKETSQTEIKNMMLRERLKEKVIWSTIKVSNEDIRNYYEKNKDKLKKQKEVKVSIIFLDIKPSEDIKNRAFNRISEALNKLKQGADFNLIAEEYSDKLYSTDLGFIKRGYFSPAFKELELSAFSLKPNQLYENIIESDLGYHLIKSQDIANKDSVHIKQILVRVIPSSEDTLKVKLLADSLVYKIEHGESFEKLARDFSADTSSGNNGGDLGYFEGDDLVPANIPSSFKVQSFINSDMFKKSALLKPINTPIILHHETGIYILLITSREEEREYKFIEIKEQLEELVKQEKGEQKYLEWIEEEKSKIYIDNRME